MRKLMTSMRMMPRGIMLMMRLFQHVGVIDNYDDVDDDLDVGDVDDYDDVDVDGETAFVYIMCVILNRIQNLARLPPSYANIRVGKIK